MLKQNPLPGAAVLLLSLLVALPVQADALERLALDRLKATHESVELLKQDRQPVSLPSEFTDYRAAMHVHSLLSHDSRSTTEEIRKAAQTVGVKIVMFTEHPAPSYDYFKDGHRGLKDGVLFIPGAEETGLQCYPQASVPRKASDPQGKVDEVVAARGQAFLCHLEERMDWDLKGLTGSEIYNLHADFKDETRLIKSMASGAGLLTLMPASRQFPQETMAALLDYPADYLRRYDELCQKERLTGVAANDAHHNNGVKAFIEAGGKLKLEDRLGKTLGTIDTDKVPLAKPFVLGKKPGDVITLLDLDPYERSLRHVSTHMFLKKQTEADVRDALVQGRVYVSFDWMADPTGFNFQATRSDEVYEMGREVPLQPKGNAGAAAAPLTLRAVTPLPARFRLIRNGKEEATLLGRRFEFPITTAGVYRLEAWLNLADGPQIWILSNPIYVR